MEEKIMDEMQEAMDWFQKINEWTEKGYIPTELEKKKETRIQVLKFVCGMISIELRGVNHA